MSEFKEKFEAAYRKYGTYADPKRFIPKKRPRRRAVYASFNQRCLAFMVDYLLMLIPLYYPLYMVAGVLFGNAKANFFYMMGLGMQHEQKLQLIVSQDFFLDWTLNNLLTLGVAGIPLTFLWIRFGNTPGMFLTRIRIVDAATWGRPSVKQCITRYLGWFLAAPLSYVWMKLVPATTPIGSLPPMMLLALGFLWVLIDRRKQAWHDYASNTRLVNAGYWGWEWRELTMPEDLAPPPPEPDETPNHS